MAPRTRTETARVASVDAPLPVPLDTIAERLDAYARDAQGAFADNTVRALQADTKVFADWCRANSR